MSQFVTLHVFQNPFRAEVVKTKLESEGIQSFILDQNVTYTIGPTIMDGFRLQVRRTDVVRAQRILEKALENPE